ncbi:hypothetical protein EJ110_NYTH25711 [Nymphaea thermarum]|nr:hypothetical protein EJ110_NYTH25711 [Nymphaea thermarum]
MWRENRNHPVKAPTNRHPSSSSFLRLPITEEFRHHSQHNGVSGNIGAAMARTACCLIFLIVLLLPLGLVDMAQSPFWLCGPEKYETNSTFDRNLRRALASFVANVSLTGFSNATEGRNGDQVIATVQCRGDLDGEACQGCVSDSTTELIQRCTNSRFAFFLLQDCLLYYRDKPIPQYYMVMPLAKTGAMPDPQRFRPILISFFNNLIRSAITNPSGRFFWGDKFNYTKDITVYSTAQCMQSLGPQDCKSCLDMAFNQMLKFVDGRLGGAIFYRAVCLVRYETYPFFTPSFHKIDPSSVNFISSNCSLPASANMTGTLFHRNLKVLLTYVTETGAASGFYSDTVGLGSNQVYGQLLCRGDVPVEDCWNCSAQASTKILELCPNSRSAIIWLDHCQLRYSDVNFAGAVDVYDRACQPAVGNASSPATFNHDFRILISNLTSLTTQRPPVPFFATGISVLPDSKRIYALVQCARDIPEDRCRWCLQDASSDIERCSNGKGGGRIHRGSCSLAFGVEPFFFGDPTLLSLPQSNHGKNYKEAPSVDIGSIKENEEDCNFPQIDLRNIQHATDNFSEENKLGEGGYGPVYKGKLPSGQEIAVKRLSGNSGQGAREFRNEAKLIAKLQHSNLVRLIGCCLEKGEKLLVYEYMPNKSLDCFLKGESFIFIRILGLTSSIGISKAGNILLDGQMNPKISDFGMARIFTGVHGQATTSVVVGT